MSAEPDRDVVLPRAAVYAFEGVAVYRPLDGAEADIDLFDLEPGKVLLGITKPNR